MHVCEDARLAKTFCRLYCVSSLDANILQAAFMAGVAGEVAPSAAGAPTVSVAAPLRSRRKKAMQKIDLDTKITEARTQMMEASKALTKARQEARNEKRKKARLLKKATGLTMLDLGRIAQMKHAGVWDPSMGASAIGEEMEGAMNAIAAAARSSSEGVIAPEASAIPTGSTSYSSTSAGATPSPSTAGDGDAEIAAADPDADDEE